MNLEPLVEGANFTKPGPIAESPWTSLFFFLPFIIAATYLVYLRVKYNKKYKWWLKEDFPKHLPDDPINLAMACLSAGALMIRFDRVLLMEKVVFLVSWCRREFPGVKVSYGDYIDEAIKNPLRIESLRKWLALNLDADQQKRLVQCLVHLSHFDEVVKRQEYTVIYAFADKFRIPADWLDEELKKVLSKEKAGKKERKVDRKVHYLELLGLSIDAGMGDIRKAYRKLAKVYHPDRFERDTTEVKEKARQKFMEIQEAYENLCAG